MTHSLCNLIGCIDLELPLVVELTFFTALKFLRKKCMKHVHSFHTEKYSFFQLEENNYISFQGNHLLYNAQSSLGFFNLFLYAEKKLNENRLCKGQIHLRSNNGNISLILLLRANIATTQLWQGQFKKNVCGGSVGGEYCGHV